MEKTKVTVVERSGSGLDMIFIYDVEEVELYDILDDGNHNIVEYRSKEGIYRKNSSGNFYIVKAN